jgi:hypothetical protein
MHTETPLIASLLRELHAKNMLRVDSAEDFPQIEPESEILHAVFYLLQEVGDLPLRFRFKGAVSPFSSDLSEIFSEYNLDRGFWGRQAERGQLSDGALAAVTRVAEIGHDVPDAFIHSPPDYERWWFVLATYLFVARSPLYATGARTHPLEDLRRYLPGEPLKEVELEAAADRVAALS